MVEQQLGEIDQLKEGSRAWKIFSWKTPQEEERQEIIDNIIANGGDPVDIRVEGYRNAADMLPDYEAEISFFAWTLSGKDPVKCDKLLEEYDLVQLHKFWAYQRTELYIALERTGGSEDGEKV